MKECNRETEQNLKPMQWNQLSNSPRAVRRLSLLAGYLAGESCSVYAIFIAHTMSPVSYRMVENNYKLRAIYGRYQETYNFDGLVLTLVASFAVFALAWCAVQVIASAMANPNMRATSQAPSTLSQ